MSLALGSDLPRAYGPAPFQFNFPMPHDAPPILDDAPVKSEAAALITAFGDLVPGLTIVQSADLPFHARSLLDHEGGMTAALEAYWHRPMRLHVLASRKAETRLSRAVILIPEGMEMPAELGLISIRMDCLPAALHSAVFAGLIPFGRILADSGIVFASRPTNFFRLRADRALADIMRVNDGVTLFGRSTVLRDDKDRRLAEVIEILGGHGPDAA